MIKATNDKAKALEQLKAIKLAIDCAQKESTKKGLMAEFNRAYMVYQSIVIAEGENNNEKAS